MMMWYACCFPQISVGMRKFICAPHARWDSGSSGLFFHMAFCLSSKQGSMLHRKGLVMPQDVVKI
jgi:hypothetical protein